MRALYRLTFRTLRAAVTRLVRDTLHIYLWIGFYDIKSDGWSAIGSRDVGSYRHFHTNLAWLAHPSIPTIETLILPIFICSMSR